MAKNEEMYVIKRSGKREEISFDKILKRVKKLGKEANIQVNFSALVMKIIDQLFDGIETSKIDELTGQQCASQITQHPDFGILASYIVVSNHQKNSNEPFSEKMEKLYNFHDIHDVHHPFIKEEIINIVRENKELLNKTIVSRRDYLLDYFGFKTLEKSYLFKVNGNIVETPQDMWLRVAIGIHGNDMEHVVETYNLMSQKYFTHATPTLFNACTIRSQLSSCYLLAMEDDSIDGIYNTLKDCANISKYAGGIGLHIHNVRASGSHIRGTNGTSNGIVPMLRVFNNTARYVDQCVKPDTYLYTTSGPMKIQDVMSNETEIINSNGEPEVIENVLEHPYNGTIYEIETMHSIEPLTITDEHPIYVIPEQKKGVNYDIIKNRLNKGLVKPEFKDVKDLNYDDMIIYNIPKYEKDIQNISEDDCYIYGIILGDGYMKNDNNTGHITLHTKNKRNIIEFVQNYFNERCIQYALECEENTTRIRWNKTINLPFRHADVYDVNGEKHVHKKWLNLPLNKIKNIIKGMIDSDGCYYKELVFDNTSRNLIESMRYMFMRCGVLTSGYIRDRIGEKHNTSKGIIETKKISYSLRIPCTDEVIKFINNDKLNESASNKNYVKFFKYNDFLCTRIKNITKTTYDGVLYDLQMKNIHDYTTHNGIVHNGGGKRNGSFAIYLEPWHADIHHFLELRKNHGDEELKARDLFYALWIPDLFMKRVHANDKWTLMCPNECPGLSDVYGDEFDELYTKYENEGKGRQQLNARDLWFSVLDSQMETGTPYLLYKDACNKKSNQKNIGTIKSSNLCTEIVEYSDPNETAVCNLASIGLSAFVDTKTKEFDYGKLHDVTKVVTYNLNKVIDINYYPTDKTNTSNMKHRPIGIGVQGLADCFILMDLSFHSEEAKNVNKLIFETIYHAAVERSNEIATDRFNKIQDIKKRISKGEISRYDEGSLLDNLNQEELKLSDQYSGCYSSFEGSPMSQGIFQFEMWDDVKTSGRYNWNTLREKVVKYGVRNSLLLAPMPTASTSQILGNNECFEPITSNIYSRSTLAGEFILANKYLLRDLIKINMWNDTIKNNIIQNKGSIQQITNIPLELRNKYKTVWEIPMKHIIDMAADRGAYICQSQSLNLWQEDPTYGSLTSMHFYGWKKGLKTGIYYLRRKAKHQAQQFTIDPSQQHEVCETCSA
jgi:ribonucleotide reductase alpha subunit